MTLLGTLQNILTFSRSVFLLLFFVLIYKRNMGWGKSEGGGHFAMGQAKLKHLSHFSATLTSYFEDGIRTSES